MMKKTTVYAGIVVIILLAIFLPFYANKTEAPSVNEKEQTSGQKTNTNKQEAPSRPEKPKTITHEATLGAVGDILIHDRVYNKAKTKDGSYDFNPMLKEVKPYLEKPDITVANQETMIGGEKIGLSSYPSFNSPQEVGDALKENGVDLVTLANNHTIDRGEKAILSAIEHWNKINMPYTGAFKSTEDQKTIRTLKRNDITFSFLSFTFGTNGIPVPKDKPYLVNLIDETKIKEGIQQAEKISDVVVLSLHFGNEYERMPNEEQKKLTRMAANAGADIIIGHHPHVLQPVAWIKKKNGGRAFVAYSLGNFFSGQTGPYKNIGGMMEIHVKKTVTGKKEKITLEKPSYLPTWVDRSWHVHPIEQVPSQQQKYKEIKKHMNQYVPELQFSL
ncbi:poly-gamma-glutamate synthesis protein (capsule biosynthesis protein) [Fictibacillus enclensis]|uniref:Capsular biosynthesis protein n=1 Tax=Fictibacillus enclensis TaxID=1017270 RepID=A0A0V8J8V0_9BACL|nr:CapA family protein [Fictibacillus enclensis]KSU83443.1 capsular biosynthesis protein [Fictibacillus enclensis]SCC15599.1 poly-gamma-glutamate synthesis protein (capsule biosynthesis protein) [Fictibacillus enclensis]